MRCVNLDAVPEGDWLCQKCIKKAAKKVRRKSPVQHTPFIVHGEIMHFGARLSLACHVAAFYDCRAGLKCVFCVCGRRR